MGWIIKSSVFCISYVLFVLFAPFLPPQDCKFEALNIAPPIKLEGVLAKNAILDKAEEVKLERPIAGPESIAIRGDDIFTGVLGEGIIKVNTKTGKMDRVAMFGKECGGEWDIFNCGRAAGLRFDSQGKLLVADCIFGVLKLDVDTEKYETLVPMDKPIDGKLPCFPDDLDVTKDGIIYFSDASTKADYETMALEILSDPTGRLIQFNTKTKETKVLLDQIHFANGVQLADDEEFVLISETVRGRVLRYYLKGEKKGQKDVFVDKLPGVPDNIRSNGKGGFYISLFSPRTDEDPHIIDLLGEHPWVRKFVCRNQWMLINLVDYINSLMPSPSLLHARRLIATLGPLGELENAPKKVIIVETDRNGKIIGSLQNDKGPIAQVSEIKIGKDYAYFGSPSNRHLFRIKTTDLPR